MAEKGVRFGSITLNGKTIDIDECSVDTLEQMNKELSGQLSEASKEKSAFLSSLGKNTDSLSAKRKAFLALQESEREIQKNQLIIGLAIFSKTGYQIEKDNLDTVTQEVLQAAKPHGIAAEKVAKQETATTDDKIVKGQERVD